MNKKTKSPVLFICRTALLGSVGLILSILESSLPDFPFVLPGMKIGLANIAVMLAIDIVGFWGALSVVLIKSVFALITRGASAFLLSFSGGILSLIIMYICAKIKKPQFGSIGLGIAGAFSHNMGQLLAALIPIGSAVYGYGAVLSLISIISGCLTGLAAGIILRAIPIDKLA